MHVLFVGLRAAIDCVRICFRTNTHMEAVETDSFLSALTSVLTSVASVKPSPNAEMAGLADVTIRCLINGCHQNSTFRDIFHSISGYQSVVSASITVDVFIFLHVHSLSVLVV